MLDREVLGVAIGGGQQPERELRQHEIGFVLLGMFTVGQQGEAVLHRRPTIALVLAFGPDSERLTEVLLGQPGDPRAVRQPEPHFSFSALLDTDPAAVEPCDDESLALPETSHLGLGNGQAEPPQDAAAQPLILDRGAHVGLHVANPAERKFQDVRRGRRPSRPVPAAADSQQRRLLLRASDRQPQILLRAALPKRRVGCHRRQGLLDLPIVERAGINHVPARGLGARCQQLHCADAVAPDRGQQIKGLGRTGTEAAAQPAPDLGAVGQQVVEVVRHHVAAVLEVRGERQ